MHLCTKTNAGDASGVFEAHEPRIMRTWWAEPTLRCKAAMEGKGKCDRPSCMMATEPMGKPNTARNTGTRRVDLSTKTNACGASGVFVVLGPWVTRTWWAEPTLRCKAAMEGKTKCDRLPYMMTTDLMGKTNTD